VTCREITFVNCIEMKVLVTHNIYDGSFSIGSCAYQKLMPKIRVLNPLSVFPVQRMSKL
jgi:hypothetical protein